MVDQSYNEVPDTSRSTTYANETGEKIPMRLVIQVDGDYDIYIFVNEEDVPDLTVDHLKFRIKQMGVPFEKFKLTFGQQQLVTGKLLLDYQITNGDRIFLEPQEGSAEKELQLSSEPRAEAVRAESLKLIEQLQRSIREMAKEKQKNVIQNTELCGTIESQGSFEEESMDKNERNSEQGRQADTPRPSIIDQEMVNPYP